MKMHYLIIIMLFLFYSANVNAFTMEDLKKGSIPEDIPTSAVVEFFNDFTAACQQSTSEEYLSLFAIRVHMGLDKYVIKSGLNKDAEINRWKSVHCTGHLSRVPTLLGDVGAYRYGMWKVDRKTSSYHVLCVYYTPESPEKCSPIVRAEMENGELKIGER